MNDSSRSEVVAIRRAQSDDLDAIAALERDSFGQPWSRRSFADLLSSRQVVFFVAGSPGELSGYAVLFVAGDEAELANIAVANAERGRGIGRRLLTACADAAYERGARQVFLEVRASNSVAQSLYASAGFVEVSRRVRYYDHPVEDALVLRLSLLPGRSAGKRVDAQAERSR